ncbi:hypothetical protein GQR58_015058 [Nymphon striatum]|nr:hypothetical protein GQR58_020133 [Nymphon striatum]KAG1674499.1 hypothetical protein GQR58_015058 [Nymphon striatum]
MSVFNESTENARRFYSDHENKDWIGTAVDITLLFVQLRENEVECFVLQMQDYEMKKLDSGDMNAIYYVAGALVRSMLKRTNCASCKIFLVDGIDQDNNLWLCELDEVKGLALGKTYRNETSCRTFAKYIAESSKQQLTGQIQKAKFFSITSDSSTESSYPEQEIGFMRVVLGRKIHTEFAGITSPKSSDAEGIIPCLAHRLELSFKKLYKDRVQKLDWTEVQNAYLEGHGNILPVIYLIRTLPVSSSENEHGFSSY